MQYIKINGAAVCPGKIACVGRNYVAHIHELGNEIPDEMVVFNKPNSAITTTLRSYIDEQLHYEAELAFTVHNGDYSAVGFGLDLTKRELQSKLKNKGLPWERAKAFDGAALFSDFVELPGTIDELTLSLEVDGVQRQSGGVSLMMYKPATILQQLKSFMSLNDGDIIMTGTPEGVGFVQAGEQFTGSVLNADQTLVSKSWLAQ